MLQLVLTKVAYENEGKSDHTFVRQLVSNRLSAGRERPSTS
jgi:hypothetical protein